MAERSAVQLREMTAVATALDEFAALQATHREALARGKIGDLREWGVARERAFSRLRMHLETLAGHEDPGRQDEIAIFCRTRIAEILAAERLLKEEVAAARQATAERLQAMRKGKKMLRGYSGHGSARGPTVFSSKT